MTSEPNTPEAAVEQALQHAGLLDVEVLVADVCDQLRAAGYLQDRDRVSELETRMAEVQAFAADIAKDPEWRIQQVLAVLDRPFSPAQEEEG